MMTDRPRYGRCIALSLTLIAAVSVAGCQSGSSTHGSADEIVHSDPNESFSSKVFGVAASPRVTNKKIVRKGGGRDQVGKPYKVRGKWYYPKEQPGYVKVGEASWYGASFHGRLTANGEVYDMFGLSAAHPTFPLPSYARVTNLKTGSQITVRVNDRGPYAEGRVMDLSSKAAEMLGYKDEGLGNIKVEYAGRAPLEGDDTAVLMASYRPGTARAIDDGLASGVMIAMNDQQPNRFPAVSSRRDVSPDLPGVKRDTLDPASLDEISVGSIIGQAAASQPNVGAIVPKPTSRRNIQPLIVTSFAPSPSHGGAAAAIDTLAGRATLSMRAGERIEIGNIDDAALLAAVRAVAEGHGRLVVDASGDGEGQVLALDATRSDDVDGLLQKLWAAGAVDAFVLRD